MLTLTREVGQKIVIGDDVVITVVSVSANGRVRLGIEAPKQVRIDREEVLERVRQRIWSRRTRPKESSTLRRGRRTVRDERMRERRLRTPKVRATELESADRAVQRPG